MILIDTGPLVAILNKNDQYHDTCVNCLRRMRGSLLTTWPVITEAMYLLDFSRVAQNGLLEMIHRKTLLVLSSDLEDVIRIRDLMDKYADLPMDFADATLVALAERERLSTVFTIDRDFSVYRIHNSRPFEILPSV